MHECEGGGKVFGNRPALRTSYSLMNSREIIERPENNRVFYLMPCILI